jgi:lipoic acid synthetase
VKSLKSIPIVVESGGKYQTEQGGTAIKDGIKSKKKTDDTLLRKPEWLRIRLSSDPKYKQTQDIVQKNKLSTVCEEAKCPNISECWSHGTATIMLMGSVCTRACRFCSVDTGNPKGWLDKDEPANAAQSVQLMDLNYIVLTSVDRDDLADGGAAHYANTIRAIKQASPKTKIEALTGDFQGDTNSVQIILDTPVDVFAQNIETVRRLTHPVRDPRSGYQQTLDVLAYAKQNHPTIITKTSLMLGLGETLEEVAATMDDLREIDVDVLTLGQYMQPTRNHLDVVRYVTPSEFKELREIGLKKGFMEVASGPLVRSSYRADRIFTDRNLGL